MESTIILSPYISVFSETEMKNKIDELKETLSDLRMKNSSLEERIVKEESDKLVKLPAIFVVEYLKRSYFISQ